VDDAHPRCLLQCYPSASELESNCFTGTIERLYIEGTNGYGVLVDRGEDAVLLILASKFTSRATDAVGNQANQTEIKNVLIF